MRRSARAAHVTRLDTWINRVTGVPMEPRAAVGIYDPASGRYTLYAGSGGIVRQKRELAAILGVPIESVRVVAREIGGNFGTRNSFFPEFALVAWASRTRRPAGQMDLRAPRGVRQRLSWAAISTVSAELALDADGRFLALRSSNLSNVGAHSGSYVPLVKGVGLVTAGYRIPVVARPRARRAVSNTAPTTPYRSAGRPEVIYVIERLIDKAAREHGFDRVALRRRNLIPPSAFPYKNPQGMTYDNGTYRAVMDRALELGDWKGFKKRRAEARKRKRLRGIGLCQLHRNDRRLSARARRHHRAAAKAGSTSWSARSRAARATRRRFAQCVAEWLGVPFDDVYVIESDTDIVKEGGGSHSGPLDAARRHRHGQGLRRDHREGQEDRRPHAGNRRGRHRVRRRPLHRQGHRPLGRHFRRRRGRGRDGKAVPEELRGPLAATATKPSSSSAFPTARTSARSRSIRETGALDLVRYTAVDDVGRAINPMVVDGQTHGGAAQGIGQALWELCAYDARRAIAVRRRSWTTPCRAPTCCRHSPPRSARCSTPDQPARRARRRRGRHHRRARRRRQCRGRRARRIRRQPYRNAGDAGEDLAGD